MEINDTYVTVGDLNTIREFSDDSLILISPPPEVDSDTQNITVHTLKDYLRSGMIPTIDDITKHWIINGTDTGIKALGKDGETPSILINQVNSHWIINNQDTGIVALGVDGDDGISLDFKWENGRLGIKRSDHDVYVYYDIAHPDLTSCVDRISDLENKIILTDIEPDIIENGKIYFIFE